MDIDGYIVFGELYKGESFDLYEGRSDRDRRGVLLKAAPDSVDVVSWNRFAEAAQSAWQRWKPPGAVRIMDLVADGSGGSVLVLEKFAGLPLRHVFDPPVPLESFLPVALEIARAVERLHVQGLLHNNLDTENIWVHDSTTEVRLDGLFRMAEMGPPVPRPSLFSLTGLVFMLDMADPSTDLFCLGCVYHYLLTGREAHFSGTPAGWNDGRWEQAGAAVQSVIRKLLASDPEQRYQSAHGLRRDLETLSRYEAGEGKPAAFTPGVHDVSGRLRQPASVAGRQAELDSLDEACALAASGEPTAVFVRGNPGVGKSFLLSEFGKRVRERKGRFVSAKAAPAEGQAAPMALAGLLGEMAGIVYDRHAAKGSKGPSGEEDSRVREALSMMPDIAGLLDGRWSEDADDPRESLNRCRIMVKRLARFLARPGAPLVLFLDDLQWVDQGTLDWITEFLTDSGSGNLLLVGAYRADEVNETHPVQACVNSLRDGPARIVRMNLAPLDPEGAAAMVADCLDVQPAGCLRFAGLVFDKTSGTPFFILRLLHKLAEDGLLRFDWGRRRWMWDASKIGALPPVHDEKSLVLERMSDLPAQCRLALGVAACAGGRAEAVLFETVLGMEWNRLCEEVRPALEAGLARVAPHEGELGQGPGLVLSHDTVVQAVAELPEVREASFVLRVGEALKQRLPERPHLLFHCVDRLNQASRTVSRPDREELARLNLDASLRAGYLGSFDSAWEYLSRAMNLLGDDPWEECPELASEVYRQAAETAYMRSRFDEARDFARIMREKAPAFQDRVRAGLLMSRAHLLEHRFQDTLETLVSLLRSMGYQMPENPTGPRLAWEGRKFRRLLAPLSPADVLKLPETDSETFQAACSVMLNLVHAAYFHRPLLGTVVLYRALSHTLEKGLCPQSSAILAFHAFNLRLAGKDIDEAYRWGEAALALQKRYPESREGVFTLFSVHALVRHWREPMINCMQGLKEAVDLGLRKGNFEFAALACFNYSYMVLATCRSLEEACDTLVDLVETGVSIGHAQSVACIRLNLQVAKNLMGQSGMPDRVVGEHFDEDREMDRFAGDVNIALVPLLRYQQMYLAYHFGHHAKAVALAEKIAEVAPGIATTPGLVMSNWYQSLALLAATYGSGTTGKVPGQVRENQRALQEWAGYAPVNHQHRFDLVEAEINRVSGNHTRAAESYELAARGAGKNGYLQDEALAYELAAKFHMATHGRDAAYPYYRKARSLYLAWGARAKVRELDERFARFFSGGP
ncbi:MAG: ATP-binding protein [Desulfatibacillaceae bacterium]